MCSVQYGAYKMIIFQMYTLFLYTNLLQNVYKP